MKRAAAAPSAAVREEGVPSSSPKRQCRRPRPTVAERLMLEMGYSGSGGLGPSGRGIRDPVEASTKIGSAGLGFEGAFERKQHVFDRAEEGKIMAEAGGVLVEPLFLETPLPAAGADDPWVIREGPPPESVSSTAFCSQQVQDDIVAAKTKLDHVDARAFLAARNRANPFEAIKREMFQNRAALKLAEIDASTGWLLTQPGCCRVEFGDICAGPGGFSEYMLTRLKYRGRAFGLTLAGRDDFKLRKFNPSAPTQAFRAYYGPDRRGDITNPETTDAYLRAVFRETAGRGLDVVLGDGGFSVAGRENRQEVLSRQLVLGQFLVGLATLRAGGTFLCKMFDTFLPFTVQLMFLLRQNFERFCILKPKQSRPANAERYVLCTGFRKGPLAKRTVAHLTRVNARLTALAAGSKKDATDVLDIVTRDLDPEFCTYVREANERLAQSQLHALRKLHRYIEDPSLPSDDQARVRELCLAAWAPPRVDPQFGRHLFDARAPTLACTARGKLLLARRVLAALPYAARQRGTLVGVGGGKVYFIDARGKIETCRERRFARLPGDTVLDVDSSSGGYVVRGAWALPDCLDLLAGVPEEAARRRRVDLFLEALGLSVVPHRVSTNSN
jgi:cap1 methyltransferase